MTNNNAPTILLPSWGGATDTCRPEVKSYPNGRLAIDLLYFDEDMQDWFPHCHVTVNCPDVHLNEGEFLVKDWSENELIAEALFELGWLEDTGREVSSGFIFPKVCRAAGPLKEFLDTGQGAW